MDICAYNMNILKTKYSYRKSMKLVLRDRRSRNEKKK